MRLSNAILGTSIVGKLEARQTEAVLQIGSDRFTRHDLASVDCYNFAAAFNLSQLLNEHLQVKNLKEVYDKVAPSALALPRLGAISLAVLGAAFEARGLGGDDPLANWVRKHTVNGKGGVEAALVTFHTIKQRELTAQREEKKAARRRKEGSV